MNNFEFNQKLVKGQTVVAFLSYGDKFALAGGVTQVKSNGPKRIADTNGFSRLHEEVRFVPVEDAAVFYLHKVHGLTEDGAKRVLQSDDNAAIQLIQEEFSEQDNYRAGCPETCLMIVNGARDLK